MGVDVVGFSTCGVCNGLMDLKHREVQGHDNNNNAGGAGGGGGGVKKQVFLSCESESCQVVYPLPAKGSLSAHEHRCPLCDFQVLNVGPGHGYNGNGYTLCPKCFRDPPEGAKQNEDFRCFQCSAANCKLAQGVQGGDLAVLKCRTCNGEHDVTMRKTKAGKFMLTCAGHSSEPKCGAAIFFPTGATRVQVGCVHFLRCLRLWVRSICGLTKPPPPLSPPPLRSSTSTAPGAPPVRPAVPRWTKRTRSACCRCL